MKALRRPLEPRVLLVSPPWTSLNEPSLGLALLSALLKKQRIDVRVVHLNLFTLEFLRAETYDALARIYGLNDFVFSGILDPEVSRPQLRLLREKCSDLLSAGTIDHRKYGGLPGIVSQILRLRSEVIPAWIDREVERLLEWRPTLAGFTCMFDQTIASVAIASRIKARSPDVLTALGGYAVRSPTGEMLLDAFPCIDAVCTGEGEPCIVPLARASADGTRNLSSVPNIIFRDGGKLAAGPQAPRVDLNKVPVPDYDDFYSDLEQLSREHAVDIPIDLLPLENSRGCWWGATHHCVFCGIHDEDLAYRTRSADAVIDTLDALSARYNCKEFRFADYILPHTYYATLLPALIARGAPYRLKCEIKANVNEERMRLLASAGFVEVQPGVESFSTSVLRSMSKGVSAIQNVYLLLLGRRFGITILYNLLYGLPDDDAREAEVMATALPSIFHLDPPSTRGRIQITRYAPLQADPARFGLEPARHEKSYELIFSKSYLVRSGFDLDRYCYMFELPFEPSPRLARIYRKIDQLCDRWVADDRRRQIDLLYDVDEVGRCTIHDSREDPPATYELDANESAVLLAADAPCALATLRSTLPRASSGGFEKVIEGLAARKLIFEDGEKLVSLALPRAGVADRRHWWDNYESRWSGPAREKRQPQQSEAAPS